MNGHGGMGRQGAGAGRSGGRQNCSQNLFYEEEFFKKDENMRYSALSEHLPCMYKA